ncbi:hypothetical protein CEXT_722231 [Caerostris extrusa]|uniref:Uncharacterized protein n=1 Tax=Caerostris extrusa TaxID=172846 RepID=A0AAV4Y682_CAEEX|nr:hypothetical protein CEXT_722231 [Caerostris extrusa]
MSRRELVAKCSFAFSPSNLAAQILLYNSSHTAKLNKLPISELFIVIVRLIVSMHVWKIFRKSRFEKVDFSKLVFLNAPLPESELRLPGSTTEMALHQTKSHGRKNPDAG